MTKNRTLFVYVALAGIMASTSAWSATCANRDAVVTRLESRFGETSIANAMSDSRNVLEVFASPNMRTWSILVTLPDRGVTCLAASGKGHKKLSKLLRLI